MINIFYQNSVTGDNYDLASIAYNVSLDTAMNACTKLEFSLLRVDFELQLASRILFKIDDKTVFFGYVTKISKKKDNVQIICYDSLYYLKRNKETYVFEGKKASEIVNSICKDFELQAGNIKDTGYVIPSMICDSMTLLDIVCEALDRTLVNAGKMFYICDDQGKIDIQDVSDNLYENAIVITDISKSEDLEKTYNQIKLAKDNKKTGKRDIFLTKDSEKIKQYGLLQDYQKVNDNLNGTQIKRKAEQLLELYNRPTKSLSVEALSDIQVKAGMCVFIENKFYICEQCKHNFDKGTMSLKLKV